MYANPSEPHPVQVVRCSPSILNQEEFTRYSNITQVDSYPRKSADFSEEGMSIYMKKLNAGMHSKFFSSVCFPSSSRESLLGRISQGRVYAQTNEGKKVPVIKFREGVFKSLKIVKPVPVSMLKTGPQTAIKPLKSAVKATKKPADRVYFRNKLESNLLLDNCAKHKPSLSMADYKQDHLPARYFGTTKIKPKASPPIKLVRQVKLYDRQNYESFINQEKPFDM
eukprot:TRINITY_DN2239_c0_g2_i4.p1 TRINITY_DN2239_c0_g2~~TRINITY_DN2239_c0_g2_i4.p1  ORF type:complete len:256 (-),score=36.75 TRINITY_DN2239_c0_g2_i4:167-838(-)